MGRQRPRPRVLRNMLRLLGDGLLRLRLASVLPAGQQCER
jgi:hypothetical protein